MSEKKRRAFPSLLLLLCFSYATVAQAGEGAANGVSPVITDASPAITIGFVGGFVHPDDVRHAEVQLARRLSVTYGGRLHSEIFDNHHRQEAYLAVRRWLDTDKDGDLSDAERRASRIILFGHSWGAAAVVDLARELQRENIPVLLTIQVDSIHKIGEDDRVVPANVAKAVNFYQTRGWLHGRPESAAADPTRTQILGQFRSDYPKMPGECHDYPWLNKFLFKGHTSIECDPNIWSQVGDLIDAALSGTKVPSVSETALK
jgi:hypothetical protein